MEKIKKLFNKFGILVIRIASALKRKLNLQRFGLLIAGVALLLGITQAKNIQRLMQTSTRGDVRSEAKLGATKTSAENNVQNNISTGDAQTSADPPRSAPDIVDLIGESELILRGGIKQVTDGFQNGVPYTEVTVTVDEAIRGQIGAEYTYRQFGLKAPRAMGNGKINLSVSPAGWAKYEAGQEVVLFLYREASLTGLRTTVGLGQGKLEVRAGSIVSQFDNAGLFDSVSVDANLLNDRDKRLLATKKGAVNKESFLSLVRRAVKDKWIERGKMRHAKK